jgi:hypothetical protein
VHADYHCGTITVIDEPARLLNDRLGNLANAFPAISCRCLSHALRNTQTTIRSAGNLVRDRGNNTREHGQDIQEHGYDHSSR